MVSLEEMFDRIHEYLNVPIVWKGIGKHPAPCGLDMAHTIHRNVFCDKIKKGIAEINLCRLHDNEQLYEQAIANGGKPFLSHCHAGVSEIVVPVMEQGDCVEVICMGPFRERNSECAYEEARSEFDKLVCFAPERIERIVRVMEVLVPMFISYKQHYLSFALQEQCKDQRIAKVLAYLEQHMEEAISLAELGKMVFLSASRLSHLFGKEMGCSINEYLRKIKIRRAKELLSQQGMPIYEVMRRCGFPDQSRFCRVFKESTGLTPAVYRRQMLQSQNLAL